MKLSELRRRAVALIKQGEEAYQRRVGNPVTTVRMKNLKTGETQQFTSKRRSVAREEFRTCYGDARDLLLKHGYERALDAKVQMLYHELIPDSNDLKEAKRTTLKDLRSRDEAKRLAAAKEVCKAARGVGVNGWDEWPKNPCVVEALIEALAKEKSSAIAAELLISLGGIYERYYADLRIEPVLLDYYQSEDTRLQRTAILWSRHIENREKWAPLLEVLSAQPATAVLEVALRHIGEDLPVTIKRKLQPLLVQASKRKLRDPLRQSVYDKLLDTVEERTVANLKPLLTDEKQLKTALRKRAAKHYDREYQKFLDATLFD